MEITVYPPGARRKRVKGKEYANRKWVARFRWAGREYEITTDAKNEGGAKKEAVAFVRSLDLECDPASDTVSAVLEAYKAGRRPSRKTEGYCDKIDGAIGDRDARALTQADFDECCRILYPGLSNETWNGHVFTPLIAALNWSGIPMRKIRRPKMKPIEEQAYECLTEKERDHVIASAGSPEATALLCLWFLDGLRVTESMAVLRRDRLDQPFADLKGKRIKTIQRKGGVTRAHWRAIHPRTVKALKALPILPEDRFFPWSERWQIRDLISEIVGRSGVRFHPHMGRHTFGDITHAKGGSLRDLMDLGGWRSERAAMRYTHKNVDRQRALKKRL